MTMRRRRMASGNACFLPLIQSLPCLMLSYALRISMRRPAAASPTYAAYSASSPLAQTHCSIVLPATPNQYGRFKVALQAAPTVDRSQCSMLRRIPANRPIGLSPPSGFGSSTTMMVASLVGTAPSLSMRHHSVIMT